MDRGLPDLGLGADRRLPIAEGDMRNAEAIAFASKPTTRLQASRCTNRGFDGGMRAGDISASRRQESRLSPALCDKLQLAGNHPVAVARSPRRSLCALRLSQPRFGIFEGQPFCGQSIRPRRTIDKASSAAATSPMRGGKKGDKLP